MTTNSNTASATSPFLPAILKEIADKRFIRLATTKKALQLIAKGLQSPHDLYKVLSRDSYGNVRDFIQATHNLNYTKVEWIQYRTTIFSIEFKGDSVPTITVNDGGFLSVSTYARLKDLPFVSGASRAKGEGRIFVKGDDYSLPFTSPIDKLI